MTPSDLLDRDLIDRELCARSLRAFVKRAWHVVEPGTQYVHGWHIDAICEHLEAVTRGDLRDLVINMPPRHMKSTIVSVMWPAWSWIARPATQWLYASYALQLAVRDSLATRRLIQSPWYQRLWGDRFELTSDENRKSRFDNNFRGRRISVSSGSAVTGEGGDVIVCDDPHNAVEALSQAKREGVITWWSQSMSTRLNSPRTGARVIVMQRLHERDLSGMLLDQGGWEHLCLPARYEPAMASSTSLGWSDPRTEPGEPLWPGRYDDEALCGIERQLGSYGAAGQLQQRPSPGEGGVLKREWWQWHTGGPGCDIVIQAWDLAFKGGELNDFTVGVVAGIRGADIYLLDMWRGRVEFTGQVQAMQELSARWPEATLKVVEDAANASALLSVLRSSVQGIVLVRARDSKETRAQAWSPLLEAGNVHIPRGAAWADDLVEECAAFPHGAHDDMVDAVGHAVLRLHRMGGFSVA